MGHEARVHEGADQVHPLVTQLIAADPRDVTVRTVDIPSSPVPPMVQGAGPAPGAPGGPIGQRPGGGGNPNQPGAGFDPRLRPGGGNP